MKNTYFYLLAFLVLASCSSPKYTYNFDYYDYYSGKKPVAHRDLVAQKPMDEPVLMMDEKSLVASVDESSVYVPQPVPLTSGAEAEAKFKSMSKAERKELRNEIRSYVKEAKKSNIVKSENAAKSLGGDLKLAMIFGAVGLVFLIIGGDLLFILGAAALLIGLYFFIRYLSRQ